MYHGAGYVSTPMGSRSESDGEKEVGGEHHPSTDPSFAPDVRLEGWKVREAW